MRANPVPDVHAIVRQINRAIAERDSDGNASGLVLTRLGGFTAVNGWDASGRVRYCGPFRAE